MIVMHIFKLIFHRATAVEITAFPSDKVFHFCKKFGAKKLLLRNLK